MPYKDKAIQKAYQQEWAKRNRKPARDQAGKINKRNIVIQAKDKPCECCGNKYHHRVMQFHHRNPSDKVESISRMEKRVSVAALIAEIEKCALLCANCHAEVHAGVRELPEVPRTGVEPVRSKTDAF